MNVLNKPISFFSVIILIMLLISCNKDSESDDIGQLELMKQEIIDIIGVPICSDSTDCRIIGLGAKPCGGYWGYLVYSVSDVDSILLINKVNQYYEFNDILNRRHGWASDCMVTPFPRIDCINGVCTGVY